MAQPTVFEITGLSCDPQEFAEVLGVPGVQLVCADGYSQVVEPGFC